MHGLNLTKEEIKWFGDRMTESHTGRVIVPTYLVTKLKKMALDSSMTNEQAKDYLITIVY